VHDLFDIVCGTSTGGILACLFAVRRTRVAQAERLYDELIKK
jgi:patatin-like phospholipase/acyl hydrolase